MTKLPHVCIDRVLPQNMMQPQATLKRRGRADKAISLIGKAWINGSTLRVRFIGGSAAQRANAKLQAGWWQAACNIKFDFNDAPDAELRVSFDANDGAWSYVGTDNQGIPLNSATMNLGFEDGGTAAHEFGHAIGLSHEHQNPQGGIQFNEPVVIAALAGSPNFWNEATTRHNVLAKYRADQLNGTAFDPKSIMLYFFPAAWTLNGIATSANHVLSDLDKSFVAGLKMYPKTGPTPVDAVALTVNAAKRTSASIGAFGEEDLFKFTATQAGKYQIDTWGKTDVVMKLFGPNSQTSFLVEDDNSGWGTSAKISRSLGAGEYFVQVRHANAVAGTGKYSIRVRKM